ncbi:hypothetical protein [Actinoplanes sp. NPDC049599]|uniref:hypothetical protein n=1 Tax=Actinoplanes sp. NPDC049599 TaxID=3363903 RepID=UPI00379CC5ED
MGQWVARRGVVGGRAAWGPAKQIAAELAARGIDLTDPEAVDGAMQGLNAERLARRLID